MDTHLLHWTTPPSVMSTAHSPDGALLGDGDLGATVGGSDGRLDIRLGKNDAWSRTRACPVTLGTLTIDAPGSWSMEHDLLAGEVRIRLGGLAVALRVWAGTLLLTMHNQSAAGITPELGLHAGWSADGPFPIARGEVRGRVWVRRGLDPLGDGPGEVAMGLCEPDHERTLPPGAVCRLALVVRSNRDVEGPLEVVRGLMASWITADLVELHAAHVAHWQAFWRRGRVALPGDPVLQRFRTAALAILGSATRPGAVAPGLFGPWITTDKPAWHGDWHLNYNFQAPLHGVWTADHPELALAHLAGLEGAVPDFRRYAAARGLPGLHAPVCIGPEGLLPEGGTDWGQRGNALFCALPFIRHWRATGDCVFLRDRAYPFLCAVADYWEAWLQSGPDGLLHVRDSTAHEDGPWGFAMITTATGRVLRDDPVQDLVNLRALFSALIDAAGVLGRDAERMRSWQGILARLAPLPEVMLPDGSTAYALAAGHDRVPSPDHVASTVIFPGLAIGLGSSARELALAHATLRAADGWRQMNGFCQVLPAAVRVGYPGVAGLLRSAVRDLMQTNGLVVTHPAHGGIETCGAICAVDDLLMQSQDGIIRLFPVWDRNEEAGFEGLRADGAFLVSAQCRSGRVGEVEIVSERGGQCRVQPPDDGCWQIEGATANACDGALTFESQPGERYRLVRG